MLKRFVMSAAVLSLLATSLVACEDSNSNDAEDASYQLNINEIKSKAAYTESTINNNDLQSAVVGQYALNFELLNAEDSIKGNNAMVSTFSIDSVLGMTWAGANGDTAKEMANVLHFDENTHSALNKIKSLVWAGKRDAIDSEYEKKDAVDVNISNQLYVSPNYNWSEDWLKELSTNYDHGLTEMNFAADPELAREYINKQVSDATRDRIKELISKGGISVNTQLVLTNAIYLKAPWGIDFNVHESKIPFNTVDNRKIDVDMIAAADNMLNYSIVEGEYQAVSVPLRGNSFSMLFVMPDEGKFNDFVAGLDGEKMFSIVNNVKKDKPVVLLMPKFTFETSLSLKSSLEKLGMKKAFSSGEADFSKMTDEANSMFIDDVIHKTFIGVDEEGVEAAAATAVIMANSADIGEPVAMTLDRPYYFVIYENTSKAPLFVGRVMDPTAK